MSKKTKIAHAICGFHDSGEFWYRFLPLPTDYYETEDEQGDCPARDSDGALPVLAMVSGDGLLTGRPREFLNEDEDDAVPNCVVAFDANEALHFLKSVRRGELLVVLDASLVNELGVVSSIYSNNGL